MAKDAIGSFQILNIVFCWFAKEFVLCQPFQRIFRLYQLHLVCKDSNFLQSRIMGNENAWHISLGNCDHSLLILFHLSNTLGLLFTARPLKNSFLVSFWKKREYHGFSWRVKIPLGSKNSTPSSKLWWITNSYTKISHEKYVFNHFLTVNWHCAWSSPMSQFHQLLWININVQETLQKLQLEKRGMNKTAMLLLDPCLGPMPSFRL